MGVREGIHECSDGSVGKGSGDRRPTGVEALGTQKAPSPALGIFLFAACLFAGNWKQLITTR